MRTFLPGFLLLAALHAQTLQSITVSPRNVTSTTGTALSQQFTATGQFSDGTVQDITSQAAWTSSNPSVTKFSTTAGMAQFGTVLGYSILTASLAGLNGTASIVTAANPVQQTLLGTLPVGQNPYGIAVNPVTNKIYVTNQNDNTVTAIDGATLVTSTIAVGANPTAVAVNPATNRIYVANTGTSKIPGNTVTVIDGATGKTSGITVGMAPNAIAVNPVTGKIYVVNSNDVTVTVIDSNNDTSTIGIQAGGIAPAAIAVNPVTGRVYVALGISTGNHQVAVLDGETNAVQFVPLPNATRGALTFLAVNPAANLILTGGLFTNMFAIDGNTNIATDLSAAQAGFSFLATAAIGDPATDSFLTGDITGKSTALNFAVDPFAYHFLSNPLPSSQQAIAVALNPLTNQIYLVSPAIPQSFLTVIDGTSFESSASLDGNGKSGYVSGNVAPQLTSLPIPGNPVAVGVNPVTNKIYVVDQANHDVLLLDGSTYAPTALLTIAAVAAGVAVNSVTHIAFLADRSVVEMLDLATGFVTPLAAGSDPVAVAVNAQTNQVYVANGGSNDVTVLDGTTGSAVNTIPAGNSPAAVRVNPVTSRIYVLNTNGGTGTGSVTAIDGTTGAAVNIPAGTISTAGFATPEHGMAVDPVANKVYVINPDAITIIDGADHTVTLPDSRTPSAVAVNPATGKAYVTDASGMVVIDGATNALTPLNFGNSQLVAVDPVRNLIYASNPKGLIRIDGATNATTAIALAAPASDLLVDAAAGKLYIAMIQGAGLAVLDEATGGLFSSEGDTPPGAGGIGPRMVTMALDAATGQVVAPEGIGSAVQIVTPSSVRSLPLSVAIAPLPGNQTSSLTPTFALTSSDTLTPIPTIVQGVHYQFDTTTGPWSAATAKGGGSFEVQAPALLAGMHILFAYPDDGQESTLTATAPPYAISSSPFVGNVASYVFFVRPVAALIIAETHGTGFRQGQQGATYTIAVANGANAAATSGSVTVNDTLPAGLSLVSMTGDGWTCPSGGSSCTRSDTLAPGGSYPVITVTVNVAPTASLSVTIVVSVTGGNSAPASFSDVTPVSALNLCDLKQNGSVGVADVQLLVNQALGVSKMANDLNGDGAITVVDVQIEADSALGGVCQAK